MPKPKVSTKSKVDKEKVNQIKNSAERKQIVKEAKVKAVQNRNARQFAPIEEAIPTITPFDVAKVEQMNDAINLKLLGTDSAKFVDEMARAQRVLDENRQRVQNADPYRVDALKGYDFGDSISTIADNSFVPTLDKRYQVAGLGDPKLSKTTHQATDQLFTEHPEFSSDEELIDYYESIPNYNPFQRWFKKYDHDENGNLVDMDERTNTKQALNAQYNQAINRRNLQTLYNAGLTDEDILYFNNAILRSPKGTKEKDILSDPRMLAIDSKIKASGLTDKEWSEVFEEYEQPYMKQFIKEHPVTAVLARTGANPVESISNVASNTGNYFTGNPLEQGRNTAGLVDSTLTEDMNGVEKFLYNVGTSTLDMASAMALSGGVVPISASLMGFEKANSTMDDAIARGLNPNQIMAESIASGVTTALTEAIPMNKWEEIARKGLTTSIKDGAKFWKELSTVIAAGSFPEATQEGLEDIADTLADAYIAGDKSNINLQIAELEANGVNHDEAVWRVWVNWLIDTGLDALAGGISGGLMTAGKITLGNLYKPDVHTPTETDLNPLAEQNLVNDVENALANEEITGSDVNNLGLDNSTENTYAQDTKGADAYGRTDNENNVGRTDGRTQRTGEGYSETYDSEGRDARGNQRVFRQSVINDDVKASYVRAGADTQNFVNVSDRLDEFSERLEQARQTNKYGLMVSAKKPQDMIDSGALVFMSENGNSGALVTADGDIEAVFHINKDGLSKTSYQTIVTAIQNGGTKLDCYGADLVNNYNALGFEAVSMTPWDEAQAPDGWTYGAKDVYAMKLRDGVTAEDVMAKLGVPEADGGFHLQTDEELKALRNFDNPKTGYDEAMAYRDSLIKTTNSTPAPSNNQNNVPTMEQSNETASFNSVQNAEVPNIDRQYQPQGGETYVSQTATNTGRRSETFFNQSKESAEFLDKEMAKDRFTKNRVSEVDSLEAAKRMIDENRELAERTILESPNVSQVQIDAAAILIDDYISKNDMERAGRLMDAVVEKTHNAAQVLQALAKYTRTATGTMLKAKKLAKIATDNFLKTTKGKVAHSKIQTALNNIGRTTESTGRVEQTYESIREDVRRALTQELASVDNFTDADVDYIARKIQGGISTNELTKLLETRIATGSFGMSDADIQEIVRLFDEADQYGANSRKANELHQKAYAIAAKYIGEPTFMDKWNAWRYLAMLGNPRTHIRNIVGNVAFGAVTDFKDNIAAYIEEAVDKVSKNGIDRTKAKVDRNTDKALFDASDKDFEDNAFAIATDANKWDERSEIERQRKVFGEKGFGGAVQKYNDISNTGLDVEDVTAIKRKYVRAMAGYLKANGKTGAVLNSKAEADVAFAKKARDYAIEQARIATFHEKNAAAQFISNMSRTAANSDSKVVRGLGMLIESAFPFKNTPANILKQGAIEYNPLQLINALHQTGKYKVETNMGIDTSMTPAEIIDTYARGLTGTGIFALGALLASVGMLRGKKDDNDDLFDEQGYSINIGNKSYTIDWLAPSALPLFMGAEIYNSLQDEDVDSVMDVILSIGEPVIEMSMLSGLSNTLDSIAYAKNGGTKATSAIANLAVGYLSQGIPTIGGQIARSIDKTRRDTYTGLPSGGFGDTVMRQVKKDLNKIPGLSFLNQPYVNAYGETEENVGGNFFGRLAYNMLSPGYYKEQNLNPLQEELKRLDSDESIETNFLPTRPNKSYDGGRLSPEDYTNYTQAVGGNYTDISNALISDPNYQTLSDADKAEVLNKVKGFSNAKAKHDLFDADYSSTYSKMAEAYESGDIDGVVQYLMSSSLLDSAGIDKNSALGKELLGQDDLTAEEIEDIIGMSFADQQASQDKIADAVPTLDMGLLLTGSGSSARIDVENAIPYLEDLGLDDATQGEILYNNGRRSQKEIDAYNDMGGYEGVKQYYDIQYNGKTHGTASVTKDETIIYLKSLGLSVEEINRWLAILGWKPDYDG